MTPSWTELLRRLALNDEHVLRQVISGRSPVPLALDAKTDALVTVAALVALGAQDVSYQCAVDAAHAAGAENTEIIDVLSVLAPVVGADRVNAAAAALALVFGYEGADR